MELGLSTPLSIPGGGIRPRAFGPLPLREHRHTLALVGADEAEQFIADAEQDDSLMWSASQQPWMSGEEVALWLDRARDAARIRGLDSTVDRFAERIHAIDPGVPIHETYRFGLDDPANTVIDEMERRTLLEAVRRLLEDADHPSIIDRRTPDGRRWRGFRPEEFAAVCVRSAAREGFSLVLLPETPVIPDEEFPFDTYDPVLAERGTWSEIEDFARHWGDVGCRWVNLRFGIDDDGAAIVRYEAKPDGVALDDRDLPVINGGFDLHRLVSPAEFRRWSDTRRR